MAAAVASAGQLFKILLRVFSSRLFDKYEFCSHFSFDNMYILVHTIYPHREREMDLFHCVLYHRLLQVYSIVVYDCTNDETYIVLTSVLYIFLDECLIHSFEEGMQKGYPKFKRNGVCTSHLFRPHPAPPGLKLKEGGGAPSAAIVEAAEAVM